jgi:hypothetical protein
MMLLPSNWEATPSFSTFDFSNILDFLATAAEKVHLEA